MKLTLATASGLLLPAERMVSLAMSALGIVATIYPRTACSNTRKSINVRHKALKRSTAEDISLLLHSCTAMAGEEMSVVIREGASEASLSSLLMMV
ncbi:hypothetical protein [Rhodococcus globerulus]|uniref:hypothetical protein n=1 Tax=Rhodococcus globerulus TaxID=33008 RepID=UPI001F2FF5AF|nr:hypothetical protein [Rhodococcus globerulus]MCE4269249.1 hypothetical protein [Rhodococcus globerulus]